MMKDLSSLLEDFFHSQLKEWRLARDNFAALDKCEFRYMRLGQFSLTLVHNPARMISCAAKVDDKSIRERQCFLCPVNRPAEQKSLKLPELEGFEVLVNPYPVCRCHFVISSTEHIPQGRIPVVMKKAAEIFGGYAVFYNGAKAGASAPDHLHLQLVPKSEVPLISLLDKCNGTDLTDMPFGIIPRSGEKAWECVSNYSDVENVNVFMWKDRQDILHSVIIPRRAHRPSCYYRDDGFLVSPGALDMGGLVILPRQGDLDRITSGDLWKVFSETGFAVR